MSTGRAPRGPVGQQGGHAVLAVGGRGRLPFETLHGTPLLVHALGALVDALNVESGFESVDVAVVVDRSDEREVARLVARSGREARVLTDAEWWAGVRTGPGGPVLVHDALCPLVPGDFLASMLATSLAGPGPSYAAYRPVTDTVKTVTAGTIAGTIDREALAAVVAPIVVSAEAAAGPDAPPLHDLTALVGWLRERGEVSLVRGPSMARRVEDVSAVTLLECVDEMHHRVRHLGERRAGDPRGRGTPAGT